MEAAVQAACVEGEAGKDGAWKNGDQDGLGPGSRGGRMQMLAGGGFRGRINHTHYWLDISKGSRQEVMGEKAGEPGEGSVVVLSTKQKSLRRTEKVSSDTGVCLLEFCSALLVPCFLLLKENRCRIKHSPGLSYTRR